MKLSIEQLEKYIDIIGEKETNGTASVSRPIDSLVRKRIGLILAWPLILGLDVLILATSSSGLTWREIRATRTRRK